jgi:16S rRNA (guanine966-N2)-methyltransferase
VKAAIFSSLADRVIGARILDLFAGTGALGIEALSRGAASALFIDENRSALKTIERNLVKTRFTARLRQQDVFTFLKHTTAGEKFDVIFADPPYEHTPSGERYTAKLLTNPQLPLLLAPDAIFVLEKRPDEQLQDFPLWDVIRAKKYGATEVLFLQLRAAPPA